MENTETDIGRHTIRHQKALTQTLKTHIKTKEITDTEMEGTH